MPEADNRLLFQIDFQGSEPLLKDLAELRERTEQLKKENTDYNKTIRGTAKDTLASQKAFEKKRIEIQQNNKAIRELTKQVVANDMAEKEHTNSLNALRQQLIANKVKWDNLTQAERENSKIGGALKKTINELDTQVKDLEESTGRHQRSVGDYGKAFNQVGAASTDLRKELTEVRKSMQEMALAGDRSSETYIAMRDRASELQDTIDKTNAEIKIFSDDLYMLRTGADSLQLVGSGFQFAQSSLALLGMESSAFQEVMTRLVATQTALNALERVSNLLRKESTVIIVGKVAALKIATVATWAWTAALKAASVALKALGIGFIIAAFAALVAGIVALVKHFDKVIEAFRRFGRFLGLVKKEVDEVTDVTEDYIETNEKLIAQSEKIQTELGREIDRLKAKGVELDVIREKERQLLEEQINAAQLRLKLAYQEAFALGLTEEEREKKLEQIAAEEKAYDELWHTLELFDITERRRQEEATKKVQEEATKRDKARQTEYDKELQRQRELIQREELAQAELTLLLEDNLENRIALEEVKLRQRLENQQLTNTEIELLEAQHQEKLRKIREEYEEKDEEKEAEKIDEEAEKREKERERYLAELEQRRLDEIGHFAQRQEQLDYWLELGVLSHKEYTDEVNRLNQEMFDAEMELSIQRAQVSFNLAKQILSNLEMAGGGQAKMAQFARMLAVAETMFNVITGFSKTASVGFPQNVPLLLSFGAQVSGLISQIRATHVPSAPKLARGGVITGPSHGQGGITFSSDRGHRFEMEGNELLAVVNKYDTATLQGLSALNSGHGDPFSKIKPTNFFARGGVWSQPRQEFNTDMEDLIRQVVEQITEIPVVVLESDITSEQDKVRKLLVRGDLMGPRP